MVGSSPYNRDKGQIMAQLTHIMRHPIKSHGQEMIEQITLRAGQTLPWDRHWAVAHEVSKADNSAWSPCVNFSRGAKAPALMAIKAQLDEESSMLSLTHPDLPPICFNPDKDSAAFLEWVKPLMQAERAQSARIVRVAGRGMTDTDYPSVSINNHASLQALSDYMGQSLSPRRWRGNLWLEGLEPWQEHTWVGRKFRIGGALFEGVEPIARCLATTANPQTGVRDADTLAGLQNGFGHKTFGLYARVLEGGEIRVGDEAALQ